MCRSAGADAAAAAAAADTAAAELVSALTSSTGVIVMESSRTRSTQSVSSCSVPVAVALFLNSPVRLRLRCRLFFEECLSRPLPGKSQVGRWRQIRNRWMREARGRRAKPRVQCEPCGADEAGAARHVTRLSSAPQAAEMHHPVPQNSTSAQIWTIQGYPADRVSAAPPAGSAAGQRRQSASSALGRFLPIHVTQDQSGPTKLSCK